MPQSLEKKLQNALMRSKRIIDKYSGNRDYIFIKATDYKRTKDSSLRCIYNDYQSLKRHERIVNELQHILEMHSDSDNTTTNEDVENIFENDIIHLQCCNCKRRQMNLIESEDYSIFFTTICSSNIKHKRQFKFIRRTRNADSIDYNVCNECATHLTNNNNEEANRSQYIWPSFIWNLLQSDKVHSFYSPDYIWKFIPSKWRPWWIHELHEKFSSFYGHVTIADPKALFVDRTLDLIEWNEKIKSQRLSSIIDVCNKFTIPNVLCPWGCSEFLFKTGYMKLELIYQRFFPKCKLVETDANELATIDPARDDFIRDKFEDYDLWLYNPNWRILPSTSFKDGHPQIMTCHDHNNGCNLHYLHCCRWRNNLPSPMADQLCHAVVKPRTVKNVRAGYSSIGYQMVEQRTSFKGPDSINVTNVGRTDHNSILIHQAEARSYANRMDMKSLICGLIKDGNMSTTHSEEIKKFSQRYSKDINYEEYKIGGTYVPVEAAINMKREAKNRDIFGIVDNTTNEHDHPIEYTRKFKRIWPSFLYPCQKMDSYGCRMYSTPVFKISGSKMLWVVSTLLLNTEPLWRAICSIQMRTSAWHGYLLVYLTKECIPQIHRRTVGIFPKLSIKELSEKI